MSPQRGHRLQRRNSTRPAHGRSRRIWLSRAAWRIWWSRSARFGALRAASAYRRAASSRSPLFSWRWAATASRRAGPRRLGERRQTRRAPSASPMATARLSRTIGVSANGAARRTTRRSAPSRCPRPVWRRRGGRRWRPEPGTRRAGRVRARACSDVDALGDELGVPPAPVLLCERHDAAIGRGCGCGAGHGAGASGRAARGPRARRSRRPAGGSSRIASAARSTSPE